MDLNDFRSKVREVGLPLSSHFIVTITGSIGNGASNSPSTLSDISLMTDSVSIPGISLMTSEMRTFGEISETPYGVVYDPVQLSVVMDNLGTARKFIDDWSNQVFNRSDRTLGYLRDYARTVTIDLIDRSEDHNTVYSVTLHDAYPKTIDSIPLSHSGSDLVKVNITLSYRYWTSESGSPGAESILSGNGGITLSDDEVMQRFADVANKTTYGGADRSFDLRDWGTPEEFPTELGKYGTEISGSCGRAIQSVNKQLRDVRTNMPIQLVGENGENQTPSLINSMNNLTKDINSFGAGLTNLSKNLTNVMAPVAAISGAVGTMSGTLGAIDSTLGSLGIKPQFTKVRANLSATSAKLSQVTQLNGLPRNIQSVGANMTSMGTQFKKVSESFKNVPGSTQKLQDSLNKLGFNLEKQGNNTANGANNMQSYSDTHP